MAGTITGAALYYASARRLNRHEAFEMDVIIATFGLSVAGEKISSRFSVAILTPSPSGRREASA